MDKEKSLRLMKFWLFGTFLIVWVAMTVYPGVALGTGTLLFGQLNYWIAVVVTAVLTVVWYYLYRWYLDRK